QIDCVLGFPELDDGEDDDAVPEVFRHMSIGGEDDPLKIRMQLRATWTDNGTPDGVVDDELRWVATLDDDFNWEECRRVSAIERSSVQLFCAPAPRRAADQASSLPNGGLRRAAQWSAGCGEEVAQGATKRQGLLEKAAPAAYIAARLEK